MANHEEVKAQLEVLRGARRGHSEAADGAQRPDRGVARAGSRAHHGRGPTIDPDRSPSCAATTRARCTTPAGTRADCGSRDSPRASASVEIEGLARDGDDVSELARRLNLSVYFCDVKLLPASKAVDADTKLDVIGFSCRRR